MEKQNSEVELPVARRLKAEQQLQLMRQLESEQQFESEQQLEAELRKQPGHFLTYSSIRPTRHPAACTARLTKIERFVASALFSSLLFGGGCSKPSYSPPADQIPTIPAGRASSKAAESGGLVAPP